MFIGFSSSTDRPTLPTQSHDALPLGSEREPEDDNEVVAAIGDLAPWAVSIVLHAALVLIAIMAVWMSLPEVEEVQPIIPSSRLADRVSPLSLQPDRRASGGEKRRRSVNPKTPTRVNITCDVKVDVSLFGVSSGSPSDGSVFGKSVAVGDSGIFNPGPAGSNAKKIVYVVDASGSLMDTLPFVVAELKRSISKLSEKQSFSVIFFTANEPLEALRPGLKPATSAMRARVFEWLDSGRVVPQGKASPIEAVKRALSYEPDLVFLLSDNITGRGRYELSQSQLLAEVQRSNRAKTKINTIQFLYADPLGKVQGMRPTLEMISRQSSGLYNFVSGRELGIGL